MNNNLHPSICNQKKLCFILLLSMCYELPLVAVVDAFIPHPTSSTTRHNLESKPRVQIPIRDRTSSTLLFLSLDPEPPSNRRRNNKKNSIDYYPENTPKQSPQELKLQSLEPNNIHQKNITISEEFMDPIMILPIATISTIVLLVLGVAYTFMTNPVMEFDSWHWMESEILQRG